MPATPEPQRLAAHLRSAARDAGYDLDQPRSGAIKDIADRSGIPQSSVSRILSGDLIPKAKTFQALADVLGLDVVDLLVMAGQISPRPTTKGPTPASGLTPEEAARLLRIHVDDVPLFVAFVNRLRNTPPRG